MLRGVLFDLWGTVLDESTRRQEPRGVSRQRAVRAVLDSVGNRTPDERVGAALQTLARYGSELHAAGRDISLPDKVVFFLEALDPDLARAATPALLDRLEEAFVSPARDLAPTPSAGALDALQDACVRGLRVALVSNTGLTPGYALRGLLGGYGMLTYFDVLTFSDEAGYAKPAVEIFHCTLDALGVDPQDAVFVGDAPELDVIGPQRIGMWTVQIRDRQAGGVEPYARIGTLRELFPALESIGLVG